MDVCETPRTQTHAVRDVSSSKSSPGAPWFRRAGAFHDHGGAESRGGTGDDRNVRLKRSGLYFRVHSEDAGTPMGGGGTPGSPCVSPDGVPVHEVGRVLDVPTALQRDEYRSKTLVVFKPVVQVDVDVILLLCKSQKTKFYLFPL